MVHVSLFCRFFSKTDKGEPCPAHELLHSQLLCLRYRSPQVRATTGAPRFDATQSDDPLASQDPARLQMYLDSGWTREQLIDYVEDGREL